MEYCKNNSTYLIGNINLTNPKLACKDFTNAGPGWVGVVTDQYETIDQGTICI